MLEKIKIFFNLDKKNIDLIRNSKYFDEDYYKEENPGCKGDACKHYYYYGWKEGKSPSYLFSNNAYLSKYRDVEMAGINPLLHYLKFGRAEGRSIDLDNGYSLKKYYNQIYDFAYFYKIYICDSNVKRVNLFFDHIDDCICELADLFIYLINFCNDKRYNFRIIYSMADFELLKKFLIENNIELPRDTVFLNLKKDNYLEVGLDDKFVCVSWKSARALLNTNSIRTNIYYYLPNDINSYTKEEYYEISNLCICSSIVVLTNNKLNLKNIRKCCLNFECNDQKIIFGEDNQLFCTLDNMSVVGLELLNDIFLEGVLDSKKWTINIISPLKKFKIHFDTEVKVNFVDKISSNVDMIFNMSYDKKTIEGAQTIINSWVMEKKCDIKEYILVTDDDYTKLLKSTFINDVDVDYDYNSFKSIILNLKDKE